MVVYVHILISPDMKTLTVSKGGREWNKKDFFLRMFYMFPCLEILYYEIEWLGENAHSIPFSYNARF
jgi:hypothetical protein